MVPGELKLLLVCVMLVPVVMVLFVANCIHDPLELLYHVAVMVCPASVSVHMMYSLGVGHIPVAPFVGDGPLCVGALFVVKL